MVDVVRSEQESAPRHIKMTKDGKFVYIVHEIKNYIDVYSYEEINNNPEFTKIATYPTLNDYHAGGSAASALNFSDDEEYLVSSMAGDNSVGMFRIGHETGALLPDNRHLVSLNHESNTLTFFHVDTAKGLLVMNGKEMKIDRPNCIIFHKLSK